jgi:hypothetical protein
VNRSDILWRDGADSYSTSVRLPSSSTGEAQNVGAGFAERVRGLAGECFPALKGYSLELEPSKDGEASGRIKLRDFEAGFRISAGQDKSYGSDGQLHSCSSLLFDAEARIISLGKAEKTYERVSLVCGLAGGVAFALLFFFLRDLALRAFHAIVYPVVVVILFPLAGFLLGGYLGHLVGGAVARQMGARTARDESVVAASTDWDAFVTRAGRLMDNLRE